MVDEIKLEKNRIEWSKAHANNSKNFFDYGSDVRIKFEDFDHSFSVKHKMKLFVEGFIYDAKSTERFFCVYGLT